ncbi:30S ribosomal protein S3 [Candidatus Parcubacteria bacterium 4484_255]|nr:MAG: 30S ribosomal protein S3 [Candidatus Parcubacteria bacterium 4484_255]
MGRKVNPKIFRIPFIDQWDSRWFANKNKFRYFLEEDLRIRKFLKRKLKNCGISRIIIERFAGMLRVIIRTAKPGLIIGKGGLDIEKLKKEIKLEFLKNKELNLELNVVEEKSPSLSAEVVLEEAILELEKRMPYRRVLKKVVKRVQAGGAKGVKIVVKGRLGGVDIARAEKAIWGNLPLHTLRADIDYARGVAATTYGSIGVKVWVYKGDKFV